jgi:hypothetical protein
MVFTIGLGIILEQLKAYILHRHTGQDYMQLVFITESDLRIAFTSRKEEEKKKETGKEKQRTFGNRRVT